MYDVPTLGLNYRMSEIQAAIGRVQMRRIDENLRRRRDTFDTLAAGLRRLPNVRVLDAAAGPAQSSHYCLSLVLEGPLAAQRDDVVKRLNEGGVGTSVYYPHPVPRMTYYRTKYGYDAARFVNAAEISDRSVALPVGWHIDAADVEYIVERVGSAVMEMTV